MKIFKPKSIIGKLIISILVVVMLFNFTFAQSISNAGVGEDVIDIFLNLFLKIGDAFIWLIHKLIYGTAEIFINLDFKQSGWAIFWGAVAAIAVIAVAIAVNVIPVAGQAISAAMIAGIVAAAVGALGTAVVVGGLVYLAVDAKLPENVDLPIFQVTPQEIFGNKLPILDVNFFEPMYNDAKEITSDNYTSIVQVPGCTADTDKASYIGKWFVDGNGNGKYDGMSTNSNGTLTSNSDQIVAKSTASILKDQIGKWYKSLRTVALVGLLTVLLYLGIRVLMCSVANEKAKYKNMMQDWLVAMSLLFILHYIMAFSVTVVGRISEAIVGSMDPIIITIPNDAANDRDIVGKLRDSEGPDGSKPALKYYGLTEDAVIKNDGGTEVVTWPTNFMGAARLNAQLVEEDASKTIFRKAAYTITYVALVFFTLFYLVFYLRRIIYMAFLTIIAPLITLTYPIDKVNDGQAQGFNYWLKEYIFNLLIQPFHLILFFVLIGSAMAFATSNVLYTVVVLAFMTTAEKILRKMFGFDKSETSKAFSGAAAGALAGNAITKLAGLAGGGKKKKGALGAGGSGGSGGGSGGDQGAVPPPRTADNDPLGEGPDTPELSGAEQRYQRNEDRDNGERDRRRQQLEGDRDTATQMIKDDPNMSEEDRATLLDDRYNTNRELSKMKWQDRRDSLGNTLEGAKDAAGRKLGAAKDWAMSGRTGKVIGGVRNFGKGVAKYTGRAGNFVARRGRRVAEFAKRHPGLGRFAKGVGNMAFKGAKTLASKAPGAGRFAIRTAGGILGAGIAGTAALAAGDSPTEIMAKATIGGAGGATLFGGVENRIEMGVSMIDRTASAGGGAFIQGAYGLESQQSRDYAAFQLTRSQQFKQVALEIHPEMGKVERRQHTFEAAKISVDTGIGVDGNKADFKRLSKAATMKKEMVEAKVKEATNTGAKVNMKEIEENARKQVEQALEMSAKYLKKDFVKDMEKSKEKLLEVIVETEMKKDPSAKKSDLEKKHKPSVDEMFKNAEKLSPNK